MTSALATAGEPGQQPANGSSAALPGLRFHLVSMPWHGLGMTPLALSQVRGTLALSHPQATVTEHFCNISFAEYLLTQSGGKITPHHYHDVADNGIPLGLGDWVFAGALYGDASWRYSEMQRLAARNSTDIAIACEMRGLADGFVETVASDIAMTRPDVVGFTTTFMQSVPSLALAKRIKEKSPGTVIIFGGANCDGPMGAALHRNHRFVDYVVRGEAEQVLPLLTDRVTSGSDAAGLDGVCWWRGGESIANPQSHPAVPADLIPDASYDAWHAAFTASPVREYVSPWLVIEGSRGCWWGQLHHCRFCGLNDATINFRSRPAEHFWSELSRLVTRYQILDVITSDNIMSTAYFTDLLPRLARSGWDLRIHYELKANVTEKQIASLAAAGLVMVQFGIENFSSNVLKIMNKGVDGTTAIRVLRDAQDHGITVEWNYLYGFPGERDDDYRDVIRQIPALVHLQPPLQGAGSRIDLQRFSPYFERPELGFPERRPADFYDLIYDLPPDEIRDLAYYFDCPDAGIGTAVESALNEALADWSRAFPNSSLVAEPGPDTLVLADNREGWPRRRIELTDWQRHAYHELKRPRSTESLRTWLAEFGVRLSDRQLRAWLAGMRGQGLVFHDDGKWVALATTRHHAKLAAPLAAPLAAG